MRHTDTIEAKGQRVGLTRAEMFFAARMALHVEQGLSAAEAAQAVLDDDARIVSAFFDCGSTTYFPTADERGRTHYSGVRFGDVLRGEIASRVYAALRGAA